ncbi:MAG: restriction endonuclease subunit S [Treponema sp.]|nr:restriction endonuclease subunit S [Treponema sp.]
MEEWKECKLGDFIKIKHGYAFEGKSISFEDNNIVLVTPGNFAIGGGFQEKKCKFFHSSYPSEYILKENDLIVTMTDLSKDGDTLGYSAKVPYSDKRIYLHNQRIGLVQFMNSEVDKDFIYWFMRSPLYQKTVLSTSSGSTVKHTSPDRICEILVKLPPLPTQQKIAAILSSLDDKIELNNKINTNLEHQAGALFKNWFVDFEPFGGKMPEGWKEKTLYEYADFINGTSFKEDEYGTEGLPIIKIAELKNGITEATQYFNGEKDPKYNVENGDILFSWSGNPDTSIDIFIWSLGNGILNQHTFNVKSHTNNKWFTYCLLKYFKPEFCHRASCKQTTGLGHVTASDLKQIAFSSGDKAVSDFENLIAPIMKHIFNNKLENQKLVNIRDTLLPKLMNGEVVI